MSLIECKINGHTYTTTPLYFEDFTTLGFITEEKIFPFATCLLACLAEKMKDAELVMALYTSCKDIFNREDLKLISNMVLNREHLRIDGKKLDNAEWEKHWQSVGFVDYRVLVVKLIKANLGNFSSLSALIPGWTGQIPNVIKEKLSIVLMPENVQSEE